MHPSPVIHIKALVPAKDHALSKAFYSDLGLLGQLVHPLPESSGVAVVERFTAAQLQLRSPPLLATAA
jgi:hypothetical protein